MNSSKIWMYTASTVMIGTLACEQNTKAPEHGEHKAADHSATSQPANAENQPTEAPASHPESHSQAPTAVTKKLAIGDVLPASDVEMKNVDGKMVTIASVKGEKGTLVVFTCNHCPFAKAWEDRITALGNEFKAKGIGSIAINANDPKNMPADGFAAMVKRAKKLGLEFPYAVDATSDLARTYGATKTPEVFLFDGENKLVYHGAVDDNSRDPAGVESHYLKDALTALAGGEPIEMTSTKAVGCSIKLRSAS